MSAALHSSETAGQRLALGTVQFGVDYGVANTGGQVALAEAAEIVKVAGEAGIDTIDTAVGYGNSEHRLGQIGVARFAIVTKLPALPDNIDDVHGWVIAQVEASRQRLGVERLHGVLLHRPNDLLGPQGRALYDALCALRDNGLTRKIGISVYAPEELDTLCDVLKFDLVQAPLNLIDRRLATSGWLARLQDQGIEVHTRSAFLQGLLLMRAMPAKFSRWDGLWHRWRAWLETGSASAIQACLAYPMSLAGVDRVVVGTDSADQLRMILAATQQAVPAEFPDLSCNDVDLVDPARWPQLY